MNNYADEVRTRWGDTAAYCEHVEKTKTYPPKKWEDTNNGLMAIFAEFAAFSGCGLKADSAEAQTLVKKLREYITSNYYTCTIEILSGLGKMYVCDERFKKNIDKCGDGTADFAAEAIDFYCKEHRND